MCVIGSSVIDNSILLKILPISVKKSLNEKSYIYIRDIYSIPSKLEQYIECMLFNVTESHMLNLAMTELLRR